MMSLYAYPRLPLEIPLWLGLCGQQSFVTEKSCLFFLCPLVQTAFVLVFLLLNRGIRLKEKLSIGVFGILPEAMKKALSDLRREFTLLALIFFNLIFIHVQRSLILVAHGMEKGVDSFYFYSLFGILLLLIPYYRLRKKILIMKSSSG